MEPKKVFLETLWSLRGAAHNLVDFPPDGYEFVQLNQIEETLFKNIITPSPWLFRVGEMMNPVMPYRLVIPWLRKWRRPPHGTVLTYSYGHIVFRPEPWIIEAECAALIVVSQIESLPRFRRVLEHSLASPQCKKVICWSEAGRRTILECLNSTNFRHKVELVYYSAPAKQFVKDYGTNKRVKLIFVGTQSPARHWSGAEKELLDAFVLLRRTYDIEMTVRAPVPCQIQSEYEKVEGLKIIDQVIPQELLDKELKSADICIMPYHTTTPHTLVDAMSYELPIVGKNTWANPEYILDGITGLLVEPSTKVPFYYRDTCHPIVGGRPDKRPQESDPKVVAELVQKLSLLIENPETRRKMGQNARREVEKGKFSLQIRKEKLGRIFDEATAKNG